MYSTATDVRNALTPGGATDDASTAAGLSDEQIADAIQEADAVIDSYVDRLFVIPSIDVSVDDMVVAVAPFPIRWYSRDIAAWLVTLTFKRNKDVTPDDPVRQRYNMAVGLLQRIANGDFTLPDPPFTPPISPGGDGGVAVFNLYEGKLFGAEDFDLTLNGGTDQYYRRITGRAY